MKLYYEGELNIRMNEDFIFDLVSTIIYDKLEKGFILDLNNGQDLVHEIQQAIIKNEKNIIDNY